MKARLFAFHGVREYWVVNAGTLVTAVHAGPSPAGYQKIKDIGLGEAMSPALVPVFTISLATIDVD